MIYNSLTRHFPTVGLLGTSWVYLNSQTPPVRRTGGWEWDWDWDMKLGTSEENLS
jgi:hypothetical protein